MAAIPQPKPVVTTETRAKLVFEFATPSSPPKAEEVEVQKEGRRSPSIEVVTTPSTHVDDTAKKPTVQTITLDSSNNLLDPHDAENRGASGSTATGTGVEDQPTIHPGETELEFYYRSYAVDRGLDYHSPPWTVMEGDDISNNPSACREILGFWVHLMKLFGPAVCLVGTGFGRQEEETARLWAEAEALVKAAREGAEQLEKDKVAFEKLKQTEAWAATTSLKQELNNLKAVNAALMKEKITAEAAEKEAKEVEARGSKALDEADANRSKLNKTFEDLKNRVTILEEVTARATEAESREGKLQRPGIV
ncbi:hypothetical protein Hanom_Chr09g00784201 [Helianthus anomalus]